MRDDCLGFIGIGRMGAPMAGRLLDAGVPICIHDAQPGATAGLVARGARLASSPAEVASLARTVLISLPNPDIVKAVAFGENGLSQGSAIATLIDLSTTGPSAAAVIADGLSRRHIAWVDAPVSGGIGGAQAGTLTLMVSCPRALYDETVEPVLKPLGRCMYVGAKPGLAQTAKLVNNLLASAALAISAEGIAMGVKAGLDAGVLVDIINISSGRNGATQDKFPKSILTGSFDYGFATALALKDVKLCLEEAEAIGVPMVLGALVRHQLALTLARYGEGSDYTAIVRLAEDAAGVEIRR